MENLINFIKNLSAAEFAEIQENYAANWDWAPDTIEELVEAVQEFDYTWKHGQADGLSMEQYIFWWR